VLVLGISTLGTVLLVWAGLLGVLVAALALATRHRRTTSADDEGERRGTSGDRRRGAADRRVGLPDLRSDRVERRSSTGDRRGEKADRRRATGAIGAM
jgi:hypothetical protein